MTLPSDEIWDKESALARMKNRSELYDKMLAIFLKSVGASVSELIAHAQDNNLQQLAFKAHSIKGNAATVGALKIWECCENLELNCQNLSEQELDEECENLNRAVEQFENLVQASQ